MLTGALGFAVCSSGGRIASTWGCQGGAIGVFMLDEAEFSVILKSQGANVKIIYDVSADEAM